VPASQKTLRQERYIMENNATDEKWLKSCIEAIIFISETPVKAKNIAASLGITEKKAFDLILKLKKEYEQKNGGFLIRPIAGGYRFYSNPSFSDVLKEFVKSNISTFISQAALETLAIICYRQPVTRIQVAEIRGVRTDSVFLTLVDRGLIKEAGRLKEPGNPKIYRTTEKLLEMLGIDNLEQLPPLKDFQEIPEESLSNANEDGDIQEAFFKDSAENDSGF
jgi:segregation and condensation protein B